MLHPFRELQEAVSGARVANPDQDSQPDPPEGEHPQGCRKAFLKAALGAGGGALLPSLGRLPSPWPSPAAFRHPAVSQAPQALRNGAGSSPRGAPGRA